MTIAQSLLSEFDKEMATTRKLLERVPDGKADWKPHAKSRSIGDLAIHVANTPTWMNRLQGADFFDAMTFRQPPKYTNTKALVEFFDANVTAARAALQSITDEEMGRTWSMKRGDQTVFAMPRAAVIRSLAMNHHIHHRGQLSVYLRLNDVPLPSMYGPSADESQ